MNDDHCPQCIVRSSPMFFAQPIEINYVPVTETEHLLDVQEELIGTPLTIQFDAKVNFSFVKICRFLLVEVQRSTVYYLGNAVHH